MVMTAPTTYSTLQEHLEAIRTAPISELHLRQGRLIELLVSVVDLETSYGELTTDQPLERMDYWLTLNEKLADLGFKRLGNGHFSSAYRHGMLPKKVIKVGFKKEDSGAAYVAFCRMHQGRAGIPVIHDVQRHASCYTVVMDELLPVNTCNEREDELLYTVRQAVEYDDKNFNARREPDEALTPLEETCRLIHKFFNGIARFDMHRGNAMMDSNGNMVITDPVSFSVHDRNHQFSIDPNDLITEIELAAARKVQEEHEAMIERCKARKLRRLEWKDPNSPRREWLRKRAKDRRRKCKMKARNALLLSHDYPIIPEWKAPKLMSDWRNAKGIVDDINNAVLDELAVCNAPIIIKTPTTLPDLKLEAVEGHIKACKDAKQGLLAKFLGWRFCH